MKEELPFSAWPPKRGLRHASCRTMESDLFSVLQEFLDLIFPFCYLDISKATFAVASI
jgi:hypothetical protein